jgi:hypothetical protein
MLWGLSAREGMRLGEALGPRRKDLDLEGGVIRLDMNRTKHPRVWVLNPAVVRALAKFRPQGATGPVFGKAAKEFRAHLKLAKVERPELFEKSETRLQIRVHDLRGTFVTLALANGKTEQWVSDRTGHTSSVMINRYRRAARTAEELGLGELAPLDLAIFGEGEPKSEPRSEPPPVSDFVADQRRPMFSASGPLRGRTGTPLRAADFKSTASACFARGPLGRDLPDDTNRVSL